MASKLTVAEIMTRDVFALAPDTSLETAARVMVQKGVSGAPVVNGDGRVVGVVSLVDLVDPDRDKGEGAGYPAFYRISHGVAEILGDGVRPSAGNVQEVMTRSVLSVEHATAVDQAAERLLEFGVHRLLVMEGEILVGIISSTDLLRALLHGPRTPSR